jgi:hypothetical protein
MSGSLQCGISADLMTAMGQSGTTQSEHNLSELPSKADIRMNVEVRHRLELAVAHFNVRY